jgi:hypothetical protein
VTRTTEAIVDTQVEAYNRRDLDAFVSAYADDIKVYKHPAELIISGKEQLRLSYGHLFDNNPNIIGLVESRISRGDFVIDLETILEVGPAPIKAIAIYRVKEQKISEVWFIHE